MTIGSRFVLPYQTVINDTGVPLPGALLYFYVSGSSTPLDTYADESLTTPNANPVVADDAGVFPNIFLSGAAYKVVLTDSAANMIWTADPVAGIGVESQNSYYSFDTTTDLLAAFASGVVLADGTQASTTGRTAEGDGGGAVFYYNASDTTTADNGGTIRVDTYNRRWYALNVTTVWPELFGAKTTAVDNTSALQKMFDVNMPILFDGLFKAIGPFTIFGSPSIKGRNALTDGLLITGTAGGITVTCTVTSQQPSAGGGIYLGNFSLHAGAAGSGAALTINYSAQTAATAMIPNLVMEYMRFGSDNLLTHYWSSGVTIKNGQAMTFLGNWAAGHYSAYADTSYWFKLYNGASVPAMAPTFIGNTLFDSSKAIWLTWTGDPGIEGASFTDNLIVTNDYGFYVDGSGAGYVAPYFQFTGNQTEDYVAGIYVNNAADVWIDGSILILDGSASNGILLTNVDICNIGASNYILCSLGSPSTGAAIKSVSSGVSSLIGGYFQNFAIGLSLDAASTQWTVFPFNSNTVATPVSNLGSANLILQKTAQSGLSLNGALFGPYIVTGDVGDASIALGPQIGPTFVRFNTPLSADRTVTFSGAFLPGAWFRVMREGGATGSYTISVVGAVTIPLTAVNMTTDFVYDGATWIETAQGVL